MRIAQRLIDSSGLTHSSMQGVQGRDMHLTAEEYAKIMEISDAVKTKGAVGVELTGSTWRNINVNGDEISNDDVKKSLCLTRIHDVEIDGQAMVEIPKFHFLYQQTPTGHRWWVAPRRFTISGVGTSQVHKGFVYNGVEKDCFQIGAYETSLNNSLACSVNNVSPNGAISYNNWITYCENRGNNFNMLHFWQNEAATLLCLLDTGHADPQSVYGNGNTATGKKINCGASDAVWRGIHEFWGNMREYTRGIRAVNRVYHVSDDAGSDNVISTGISAPSSGSQVSAISPEYAALGAFLPTSAASSYATWGNDWFSCSSNSTGYVRTCRGNYYNGAGVTGSGLFQSIFDRLTNGTWDGECTRLVRVPE